jgi:redox-regulated HSP33 family molecular chaperone
MTHNPPHQNLAEARSARRRGSGRRRRAAVRGRRARSARPRWCGSAPRSTTILTKHDYPAPVGKLLGEAIVLTTLLGSSLKFEGRFILQTQTDGPVSLLVVDFRRRIGARLCALRCRAR